LQDSFVTMKNELDKEWKEFEKMKSELVETGGEDE
jgi:hypothetical protein